jgi:hypothetical protein
MKLERILGAVLGLYTACTPVEEKVDAGLTETPSSFDGGVDSPRPDICTMEGEVLFEDNFDGDSLDLSKWYGASTNWEAGTYFNNGVMELSVTGGIILQSHSTYTIDRTPLILETRWKVREREGTDLFNALVGESGDAVSINLLADNPQSLSLFVSGANCGAVETGIRNVNVSEFHTYRIIAKQGDYTGTCTDGRYNEGVGSNCLPINKPLNIHLTCKSTDGMERKCFFDYVKLIK